MRSHNLTLTLFVKEVRCLLTGRALWVLLVILSILTGYSFIQAVTLFSQASVTALQFPELARGMSPLDGIIVPTFGALYLAVTLLYPFVAIRMIGEETRSGGLKLLLQGHFSLVKIVTVKVLALASGWLLALIPMLLALGIWHWVGGHVFLPELINLVAGYTLYVLVITAIAFFASALTESNSTAAIVTLAFTLGSWVLDFAAGTQGWLSSLSGISLTAQLRVYEHGLFSFSHTLQLLLSAGGLLALCVIWLHPGKSFTRKISYSSAVIAGVIAAVLIVIAPMRTFFDVSEDRRNSFNPADERALQQMTEPLNITVYLSENDSRLRELKRNILPILRRTVPNLDVTYMDTGNEGLFGPQADDMYGLIVYEYAGERDSSRSTGAGEILPILHNLAGQTVTPDPVMEYSGYPLVADPSSFGIWFYGVLPALFGMLWWRNQHIPRRKGEQ